MDDPSAGHRTVDGGPAPEAASLVRRTRGGPPIVTLAGAVLDIDGVITKTAVVHLAAWRRLFDDYLAERARPDQTFEPFTDDDYRRYVDGKPRQDGVIDFLASRGIELPLGAPDDPPGHDTVWALGNRKNDAFRAAVAESGVDAYDGTVAFVRRLRDLGRPVAAVSASRNAGPILAAAGVDGLFDLRVDGLDAERLRLAGKPDPALFLEAAGRLGVEAASLALVEDALAGVEAGRRGGFGLVIGVDRTGHPTDLADHGADIVVDDLAELTLDDDGCWHRASGSG